MRKILTFLTATALLATPAFAQARGFDSEFTQAITGPIKFEVVVSEDLAHRANNLPKKLSDRGTGSGQNSVFFNNGFYGDRDIEYLVEKMTKELECDFEKYDVAVSDTSTTVLRVTIEDAKPNRPTINQLKHEANLSFRSFSLGGAGITAELRSGTGELIGQAEYDYFSLFNDDPNQGVAVWYDARQAFSKFSKKMVKTIAKNGPAST